MWNNLASAAGDKKHDFSNCILAKNIFKHHRRWVAKLHRYRCDIIHYKLIHGNDGNAKKKISIDVKKGFQKTALMYSVPDELVKLLRLHDCHKNDAGVDLQFGAIEIAKQSINTLKELTTTTLKKCTRNSIEFKENMANN